MAVQSIYDGHEIGHLLGDVPALLIAAGLAACGWFVGGGIRYFKDAERFVSVKGLAERDVPDYIEADHAKMTARVTRIPSLSEVPYPVQMEPNLVVEYYAS